MLFKAWNSTCHFLQIKYQPSSASKQEIALEIWCSDHIPFHHMMGLPVGTDQLLNVQAMLLHVEP